MKECLFIELGHIDYAVACELQRRTVAARKAGRISDILFLCEHPHVITLGRNGKREHLQASDHLLQQMNVEFHPTDRGGDITYHGPGQLVGYPVLDLAGIRRDVVWYVRQLEEVMLRATGDFGIPAGRRDGMTGVWVESPGGTEEKIGAIGVHIAYNVSTDLRYFDLILPCGLAGERSTSLERLLDRRVSVNEVRPRMVARFEEIFGLKMRPSSREQLEEQLAAQPAATSAV